MRVRSTDSVPLTASLLRCSGQIAVRSGQMMGESLRYSAQIAESSTSLEDSSSNTSSSGLVQDLNGRAHTHIRGLVSPSRARQRSASRGRSRRHGSRLRAGRRPLARTGVRVSRAAARQASHSSGRTIAASTRASVHAGSMAVRTVHTAVQAAVSNAVQGASTAAASSTPVGLIVVAGILVMLLACVVFLAGSAALGSVHQHCYVQASENSADMSGQFGDSSEPGQIAVSLNSTQLSNAQTVYSTLVEFHASENETLAAFMTAFVESRFLNYANSSVPGSLSLPHDAVGSDHDSVGVFQQRALTGAWGSYEQIMDIRMSTMNFLGVPGRVATARGVRHISGYESMDPAVLAQKVQVSAFPERYGKYRSAAQQLLASMGSVVCGGGEWVAPLPQGSYSVSSPFGWRIHPVYGERRFHSGIDLAAPYGTPLSAVAAGVVSFAGWSGGYGGMICIDHGDGLESCYAHQEVEQFQVHTGDSVAAGQIIGAVASTGTSTGPHLHFEIRKNGTAVDPAAEMAGRGVQL